MQSAAREPRPGPRAPHFEDLQPNQIFDDAPSITLTSGQAALHQAVTGGRCLLALDHGLAVRVAGAPLADPALVWDCAIGQSSVVTGRVIANLFYRGLVFHRAAAVGDTLRTRTQVVALKQNRSASGLAALRVTTSDQQERTVLDFLRCAMLPLRNANSRTGRADDVSLPTVPEPRGGLTAAVRDWERGELANRRRGILAPGETRELDNFEVVDGGPALVRSSLNVAAAHLRVDPGEPRLLYGGHTIGIAAGQLARLFPECLYVVGWRSCDHLAPVHEGDGLRTRVTVERVDRDASGWQLVELHCQVIAATERRDHELVLDWRPLMVAA